MTEPATPRISVVMIDGGFRERFHAVDAFAQQTLPADAFEVLWIEYYDRVHDDLAARVSQYPNARIVTLGRSGDYAPAYCFNAGLVQSRGSLLVIPDGDQVVARDFLERVWAAHEGGNRLAMYVYRFDEPEDADGHSVAVEYLERVCVLRNPTNYGGCLTVPKDVLLEVNGYDQHSVFATGYHAHGLDVYTRLKNAGLPIRWHPDLRVYHPWHSHTLEPHPQYDAQRIVIDHRAHSLATLPFEGIDATRNTDMPAELHARLDALAAKQARRAKRFPARARQLLGRLR